MGPETEQLRTRREPPAFVRAGVVRTEPRTPYLVRVTLTGPGLGALRGDEPAASVRVLLPEPGADEVVLPTWNGNEFLAADGARPPLRTLTPLAPRASDDAEELDVEVVLHDGGPLSAWARSAVPGTPCAVSGPGRGYEVDADATAFVVVGDESAAPAMGTLVPRLPRHARVGRVHEVRDPAAALDWPDHPGLEVRTVVQPSDGAPGDAALDAVRALDLPDGVRIWGAGEAAGVQRLRRHLFEERRVPRARTVVRGYWKVDRVPRREPAGTPMSGPG